MTIPTRPPAPPTAAPTAAPAAPQYAVATPEPRPAQPTPQQSLDPRFVVVLDVKQDHWRYDSQVIQIGAIAANQDTGEVVDTFEVKLQFDPHSSDEEQLAKTQFDPPAWEQSAVPAAEAVQAFAQFLDAFKCVEKTSRAGKPYQVCRGMMHDTSKGSSRLRKLFKSEGGEAFLSMDFNVADTMHLARWAAYNGVLAVDDLSLESLCKHFRIEHNAHDALGDAKATWELAGALQAIRA